MCAKVAFIIQGKNSPHYRPNKVDYRDKCIIVNAKNVFLTGKKLEQKLYRHHSGYPGGLKEIKARLYLQKNATEMVMRSIKGMIPKNKMRPEFLSKVKIYEEGGHDLTNLGLPQFGKIKPIDYNEVLQTKISPETHVIVGHTGDLDKHFPHLKDYKRELSMEAMLPRYMHKPEFKVNIKKKERLDNYLRSFRQKHHRRIRNMAYRYI